MIQPLLLYRAVYIRIVSQLVPSEEITWSSCFSGYKCARLILPLDYLSPSGAGPNATIALQMIPATDMTNYRGTILINPGGPGGSGTSAVSRYGMNISRVVGGSYDVLGFDPRGTGASTPSADCFDSESQFKIWTLQAGDRFLNLSDGSVEMARAKERVVGQRCLNALGGNGREETGTVKDWGAGRFMSTASVATDMLKIVEKLGQEKLLYWGFVCNSTYSTENLIHHIAFRVTGRSWGNTSPRCTPTKLAEWSLMVSTMRIITVVRYGTPILLIRTLSCNHSMRSAIEQVQ